MTKEEIFNSHMNKAGINFRSSLQTYEKILDAMQEYAELYHQSKLKNNGDLGGVINPLNVAKKALLDINNWDDDLQEQWDDCGYRAAKVFKDIRKL